MHFQCIVVEFALIFADTGTSTIFVKIKFHTYTASYVTNVTELDARRALNRLNGDFIGSNIHFIWDGFESHDGSYLLLDPDANWFSMLRSEFGHINLTLLPHDIDFNQNQAERVLCTSAIVGGEEEYLNSTGGISAKARINSGIVTHEIGHCLNLWHTHHGTNSFEAGCPELIEDQNTWDVCGDFIADTNPDPGLYNRDTDHHYVNSICELTTELYEPGTGNEYDPDLHNFMSYSNVNCLSRFSDGQMERMRTALINESTLANIRHIGIETVLINKKISGENLGGELQVQGIDHIELDYKDIISGDSIPLIDGDYYDISTSNYIPSGELLVYWENDKTEFRLQYANKTQADFGEIIEAFYDDKYDISFNLVLGNLFFIRDPWYFENGVQHNEFHIFSNGTYSSVNYPMFKERAYIESAPDSAHYTLRAPKYIIENNSIMIFQGFECATPANIEVSSLEENLVGYLDQYVNILETGVPVEAEFINVTATGQEVTFYEADDVISMSTPPIIDLGNNQIQVFRRWVITSGSATIVDAEDPNTILTSINTDVEISVESITVTLDGNVSISYNENTLVFYANATHLLADTTHIYEFQSWNTTNATVQNSSAYSTEINFIWENGNAVVTANYQTAETIIDNTISIESTRSLDIPGGAQYDFAEGVKIEVGGTLNIGLWSGISGELNTLTSSGGYSGSFGQSFRKVSDTLFAPVQVCLV